MTQSPVLIIICRESSKVLVGKFTSLPPFPKCHIPPITPLPPSLIMLFQIHQSIPAKLSLYRMYFLLSLKRKEWGSEWVSEKHTNLFSKTGLNLYNMKTTMITLHTHYTSLHNVTSCSAYSSLVILCCWARCTRVQKMHEFTRKWLFFFYSSQTLGFLKDTKNIGACWRT